MMELFSPGMKTENYMSLESENIRKTSRMVIAKGAIIGAVLFLVFVIWGFEQLAYLMAFSCAVHLSCFRSLKSSARLLPRLISFFTANVSVLAISLTLGFDSHVWVYFFPLCIVPLLLFSSRKRLKGLVLVLVPCVCMSITFIESHVPGYSMDWIPASYEVSDTLLSLFVIVSAVVAQITFVGSFAIRQSNAHHLLESQKAYLVQQEKMLALGTLASGISHEINNALASLQLYFDLLDRKLHEQNLGDSSLTHSAERISFIIKRIANIVASLRIYAHGDSSSMDVVSVGDVLADSLVLLKSKITKFGTEIQWQIQDFEKVQVLCNQSHLMQILMNFVSNSLDATQTTENPWIKIEATSQTDSVLIRVTDSGTGITEAVLNKIFEPFFTTKPVGEGTGLGMPISQGLANANDGKIYYELHEGHTSFVLELKSAKPEEDFSNYEEPKAS